LPGWWFYSSPVARAPEFLLGALIAQLYFVDPNLPNTRWLGIAGASWVIAAFAASYVDPGFQPSFAFAPGVAAVMLFLALHRGRAATLLATPVMRVLGDASYSIYMLHSIVLSYVIRQSPYLPAGLRIALAWGLIILLSVAVYHYFEAPARRWIRMTARPNKPDNRQRGKIP
jgi:exopolysaccharide production protein ExoZ